MNFRLIPLALLIGALTSTVTSAKDAPLTLERIFDSPSLSGPSLRAARLSPAGDRVTFLRGRADDRSMLDVWEFHIESGQTRRLIAADDVLPEPVELSDDEKARRERARIADLGGIVEYRWAGDGRHLLFPLGGDIFLARIDP
ncbi:MAG: S9 family peptidase, partial [Wenzhouxiangellaceae bacterium]